MMRQDTANLDALQSTRLQSPCPCGSLGTGNNIIYVDLEHDVVAVMRWIEGGAADGFVKRLLAALD